MHIENNTKLTVAEFKGICDKIMPSSYMFDLRNQSWGNELLTLKASFRFDNMMILKNPNRICLTYGEQNVLGKYENILKFERIKYILYRGMSAGCRFFTIVCEGFPDQKEVEYRFTVI